MNSFFKLLYISLLFTKLLSVCECKSASGGRMKSPNRINTNKNNNNNMNINNNKNSNSAQDEFEMNFDYYDSSSSYTTNDEYSLFDIDQNGSNSSSSNLHRIPDEQRLISKLLRGYDTAARPVFNASKSVVIEFGFSLIQIYDMVIEKKF